MMILASWQYLNGTNILTLLPGRLKIFIFGTVDFTIFEKSHQP